MTQKKRTRQHSPETRELISKRMKESYARRTAAHVKAVETIKAAGLEVPEEVLLTVEPTKHFERTLGVAPITAANLKAEVKVEPKDEIERMLHITSAELGVNRDELIGHSLALYRELVKAANLDFELKELQAQLKQTRGELGVELRKKAAETGTKMTDAATTEAVESDTQVVELRQRVMNTEYALDLQKATVEALRTRTMMLDCLTRRT